MPKRKTDDSLEGSLGTVTDEEWREAHEAVVVPNVPEAEAAYDWLPGTDKTHYGYDPAEDDGAP